MLVISSLTKSLKSRELSQTFAGPRVSGARSFPEAIRLLVLTYFKLV